MPELNCPYEHTSFIWLSSMRSNVLELDETDSVKYHTDIKLSILLYSLVVDEKVSKWELKIDWPIYGESIQFQQFKNHSNHNCLFYFQNAQFKFHFSILLLQF